MVSSPETSEARARGKETLGRRARDREATERRIFDAATEEFAERGLAGARIDSIASRAGANKQLIYAYFQSKERLFAEVLGRKLEELGERTPIDPDRLADYAGELFDFHAEHPELARLLLHEALHYGAGPVPNDERRQTLNERKVEAIREGQERGVIDASLDPRDLVMIVIGLAAWPSAVPQVARMIEGGDPGAAKARARRRTSVQEAARRIASAH
jgi:AcrR family transcriptional regulator